jgi:predicted nucleic acid-binding protein
MSANVFVDTNVLIYASDNGDTQKRDAARAWRAHLWTKRSGRTSFQVLEEFYSKIAQRWPGSREQARAEIRDLLSWGPIVIDARVLENAWKIQDRYGFSFWDALIVASARLAFCRYLLTEDLQADQDIDGIIVANPFLRSPAESDFR